ncbi:replication endonuclease [Roseomonas genomospecies 6]|nr:replication endonuclease [Roseomonas genomospecies 6]
MAAAAADTDTLDILDRLPDTFWRASLLKEAARMAGADYSVLVARFNGVECAADIPGEPELPSAAVLRGTFNPPPRPIVATRRGSADALEIVGTARARQSRGADFMLGCAADALLDWQRRVAEWGRDQAWRSVAEQACRITAAIAKHVGADSPYLEMIHYGEDEVRARAAEDVELAKQVVGWRQEQLAHVATLKPKHPERAAEVLSIPNPQHAKPGTPRRKAADGIAYVLSWGLDIDPEEIEAAAAGSGDDVEDEEAYASRLFDEAWHRRRIRRHVRRTREHVALILRLVGAHGQRCVSDVALRDRRTQLDAQMAWGEGHAAYSPDGQHQVMMSALMRASRDGRISRTAAIVIGMQGHARECGWVPLWITLTAPSEYHPAPSVGEDRWNPALTPDEARDWIQSRWGRVRARLEKHALDPFGIWVREPNEDGCVHLHMLLWCPEDSTAHVERILRGYEIKPDAKGNLVPLPARDARGRVLRDDFGNPVPMPWPWRSDAGCRIERKADSATHAVSRYIWEYLAPALRRSGDAKADEQIKGKAGETAERYDAHAATWGYRRFGFFGIERGVITAWQKLYTMNDAPKSGPFGAARACMDIGRAERKAAKAGDGSAVEMMQGGDWTGALRALGAFKEAAAVRKGKKDAGVRVGPNFIIEAEETVNRYGETVRRPVAISDGVTTIGLVSGWVIDKVSDTVTVDDSDPRSGVPEHGAEALRNWREARRRGEDANHPAGWHPYWRGEAPQQGAELRLSIAEVFADWAEAA